MARSRARTIAFINQKGGVGKTTLVANCGAFWAREGNRVLVIDLDPQAHLTLHLGTGGECEERNLYRVLRGDVPIQDAVIHIEDEHLDVLPSHIDLSAAEVEFGQEVGREMLLRDQLALLAEAKEYDRILIDCPPSLSFLSLNALAAADEVVVPVQAEFFALQGMAQLLRVVDLIRDRLHPTLELKAIVPTLVDLRTNLGREVISELENHFPGLVTKSLLRKRVKVAEAPSFGKSIFEYAAGSEGAEEFAALARELELRLELPRSRPKTPTPPGELGRQPEEPRELTETTPMIEPRVDVPSNVRATEDSADDEAKRGESASSPRSSFEADELRDAPL